MPVQRAVITCTGNEYKRINDYYIFISDDGKGFELSKMRGSQSNDPFRYNDGKVVTETNNCGGILGGITNGMPIIFRAAVKPTPSIAQKQKSVDLQKKENAELEIHGRHDPCIVPRAVPVIEAVTAIAIANLM